MRYNTVMKKIGKYFIDKTVLILFGIALLLSFFVGCINVGSYLVFTNWITIIGFSYLSLGVLNWLYAEGEFAFFVWKPKQKSYTSFKKEFTEKHSNYENKILFAGILTSIVAVICTILYTF